MMTKKRLKKICKGDKVLVIAGNDRGRTGEILSIVGDKVVVGGINVRKRHLKPTRDRPKGAIIDIEKAIHRSNVAVCSQSQKPVRLKVNITENGERQLVYHEGDEQVVHRIIKKKLNKG